MNTDPKSYAKSNKIETVDYCRFSKVEYKRLLQCDERLLNRQLLAQSLCDYLCGKYGIPFVNVIVTDKPQPHATNGSRLVRKTFGHYKPLHHVITMYNKTAVRKQVVSINTFVNTLLHEFMHHYDMTYLKLSTTPHTAGFYKRIADLKNKLEK